MHDKLIKGLEKLLEAVYLKRKTCNDEKEFGHLLDKELLYQVSYKQLTGSYYHIKGKDYKLIQR